MKDIYELLLEMDIDENEFEEMEVSELYKAKVKRTLKESIKQKKKIKGWKMNIALAVILIGCSFTGFVLTSPAYADRVPAILNIFRFLDNGSTGGLYEEYKNYSNEINSTEVSNGIEITINDAIYDGETVSIAYSLESNQDLGDAPYLFGLLDIKGSDGSAGSNRISKVNENNYVGLMTTTGFHLKEKDKVNIKWNIQSITIQDSKEKIKGKWNFALALKATESHTQLVNRSAEHDGLIATIDKISVAPMSFIVYYEQVVDEKVRRKWDGADVDLEVKDDLGNHYSGKSNGGSGDRQGYSMSWSKTFEKLDQHAAKLIITPRIRLYKNKSGNHGSLEITREGLESKEIPLSNKSDKSEQEFVLDDIIIDLKN
ncbi:DUF4179 domain-containing protein [Paenibacillus protaetiae]|uniref:DUF4179 domain-containing protein n=1 Tax=Paenibacillus protaetiae TaxID=2509456 RepID=A0A4P6EYQ9_9BACL|nr:DUF4179 domain-containing protein [Paenibacillus protaetiae]QAY67393.1 DUF4179 domain-containing protein [Paenibacillus protaetiae]